MPAESYGWSPGARQEGNAKRVAALVAAGETEPSQDHQMKQKRSGRASLHLAGSRIGGVPVRSHGNHAGTADRQ